VIISSISVKPRWAQVGMDVFMAGSPLVQQAR
jgi:hypothetical protein